MKTPPTTSPRTSRLKRRTKSASQFDDRQSQNTTPLACASEGPESQLHRNEEEEAGLQTPASARQRRRAVEGEEAGSRTPASARLDFGDRVQPLEICITGFHSIASIRLLDALLR